MVNCSKAESDYDANLLIGEFIYLSLVYFGRKEA